MQGKSSPLDRERRINRLAAGQHGEVSRAQLLDLGLGAGAIEHRVRTGRLSPSRRGVYSVGVSPPSRERRWMAALLACGPGAVLSHLSAAALWELRPVDPVVIDVSVPRRNARARKGSASTDLAASAARTPPPPGYSRDHDPTHPHRPRRGALHTCARTRQSMRPSSSALDSAGTARRTERIAAGTAPPAGQALRATSPAPPAQHPARGGLLPTRHDRRPAAPEVNQNSARTPSTSSGANASWSWRPTAAPPTTAERSGNAMLAETPGSQPAATRRCGSPGTRSITARREVLAALRSRLS